MKKLAVLMFTLALPFSSLANECKGEAVILEPIYGAVDVDSYSELSTALSQNDTKKISYLSERSLITSFKQGEKACLHESHFLNYRFVVSKNNDRTKYLIPDDGSVKVINYQ